MTLPFPESEITLPKKPSTYLFQMQIEWGLVYARLQAPTWRTFQHYSTAHYHQPGDPGHNPELVDDSALLLPHLRLGKQRPQLTTASCRTCCTVMPSWVSPTQLTSATSDNNLPCDGFLFFGPLQLTTASSGGKLQRQFFQRLLHCPASSGGRLQWHI